MKKLQPYHYILIAINLLLMASFGSFYLWKKNYEFMIYIVVIATVLIAVIYSYLKYVDYTKATFITLTIWAGMHLSGGGLYFGGQRLYEMMLIPMSDTLPIFRYDQLAHIFGFFSATLVGYCLVRDFAGQKLRSSIPLAIVLIMVGVGFGTMNEIVEFIIDCNLEKTGVGGYINNSLDLCANFIGSVMGWVYVRKFYLKG